MPNRTGLAAAASGDYLGAMPLPRPATPRALWKDMREFWRQRPRHQWVAALLALLIPAGILVAFHYDAQTNILPGEQVIYVDSWSVDRSDAEIIAKQEADLKQREEWERERQRQFKSLDDRLRRLGI
jgi:hypothetical protein